MANYTRRERTTTTVEYAVPQPTTWDEIYKVLAAIRNELGEDRAAWDDAAKVRADEEEIVFYFEAPSVSPDIER